MHTIFDNLHTKRLFIRPLLPSDGEFILQLVNSPGWLKFIGDKKIGTLEGANNYIQTILANEGVKYWVVIREDLNNSIGLVTFIQRDFLPDPDFGFALLPEAMHQGFMLEACTAVLESIWPSLGLSRLLAITLVDNDRSISLLTKLGFLFMNNLNRDTGYLSVFQLEK